MMAQVEPPGPPPATGIRDLGSFRTGTISCSAPGEGKSGKTAQQASPDAYPRRGGWRTTRFTSGQLLLSANRKIPEDLLVELQEFVAMTLSHARNMMKILLVHFNMKYNGESIILCITRVDFHIPPTSYPHNHS